MNPGESTARTGVLSIDFPNSVANLVWKLDIDWKIRLTVSSEVAKPGIISTSFITGTGLNYDIRIIVTNSYKMHSNDLS